MCNFLQSELNAGRRAVCLRAALDVNQKVSQAVLQASRIVACFFTHVLLAVLPARLIFNRN
jgi:hypothetical protein